MKSIDMVFQEKKLAQFSKKSVVAVPFNQGAYMLM